MFDLQVSVNADISKGINKNWYNWGSDFINLYMI